MYVSASQATRTQHRDVPSERREFKYLFPLRRLPELRRLLEGFCDPDPHAGPDGTYRIRSLYLDTWDLRLYHANEREEASRYKARIRTYPDWPSSPVFLEIKRRTLDVVRKTRAGVPSDSWTEYLQLPARVVPDGMALSEFLLRLHGHHLEPHAMVQYTRYAWKGLFEDYSRVSVDTRIVAQPWERYDLAADERGWRPLDAAWYTQTFDPVSVLELKFAGAPPAWMQWLVVTLGLVRQSYSKYRNAVVSTLPPTSGRLPWRAS